MNKLRAEIQTLPAENALKPKNLTLFQMTMGQYDPERTDLSAIARISGLGLPNFMTLFLFILCKSTQGHFDIRFQKS